LIFSLHFKKATLFLLSTHIFHIINKKIKNIFSFVVFLEKEKK